jgi:hypothetical protein
MFEPIEANYTSVGDDWTIEVTCLGKTLTATATGLIAARDQADHLVENLVTDDEPRTVVHMLDGDAVGFTAAYLTARMAVDAKPDAGAENGSAEVTDSDEPDEPGSGDTDPGDTDPGGTDPDDTDPDDTDKVADEVIPPAAKT